MYKHLAQVTGSKSGAIKKRFQREKERYRSSLSKVRTGGGNPDPLDALRRQYFDMDQGFPFFQSGSSSGATLISSTADIDLSSKKPKTASEQLKEFQDIGAQSLETLEGLKSQMNQMSKTIQDGLNRMSFDLTAAFLTAKLATGRIFDSLRSWSP